MAKQYQSRKVSISAVRRANDSLRHTSSDRFLSENQSAGRVTVQATYYGRNYEIDLSPSEIKEVYAKSLQATSMSKNEH